MKRKEVVGSIYSDMRQKRGITKEDVVANLMSTKALLRFENNEVIPNFLMVERLFQRIGASSDVFAIMLTESEYDYYKWRRQIIDKICLGNITDDDWNSEVALDRSIDKKLQQQFWSFWKSFYECDYTGMEDAISMTFSDYRDEAAYRRCISREELAYILYYIERKLKNEPQKWIEDYDLILNVIFYMEKNLQDYELVKIYGRAICVYGEFMQTYDVATTLNYYKKAIELQRKNMRLMGMERLLHGLIKAYDEIQQSIPSGYKEMYDSIREIKHVFSIREKYAPEIEFTNEVYILGNVLNMYRNERKMSYADVAKNICDEKTYRLLENGRRRAKVGTYELIIDKLEVPFMKYNADIISDKYSVLQLAEDIKLLNRKETDGKEQNLLDILEMKLGAEAQNPVNRQWINSIRDASLFSIGSISASEFIERIRKLLCLTITDWSDEKSEHYYNKREVVLIYYHAIAYRQSGRPDMSLRVLENLIEQIEKTGVDLYDRTEEIALIYVLMKDIYTDLEMYEKALEWVWQNIRFCFETKRGDKLVALLFELGWIFKEGKYCHDFKNAKKMEYNKFLELSFIVSQMFYQTQYQAIIKRYIEEN